MLKRLMKEIVSENALLILEDVADFPAELNSYSERAIENGLT